MLASRNRLRRSADFTVAVRRGRRAGGSRLVLHLAVTDGGTHPPLVGFVVSKAVGGAVVRNSVARRLRPIVREQLDRFPLGALVVVRALPGAATAPSAALAADFDAALERVLR